MQRLMLPGEERRVWSRGQIAFCSAVCGMLFAWLVSSVNIGVPEVQAQAIGHERSTPTYQLMKEMAGSLKNIASSMKSISDSLRKMEGKMKR